MSKSETTKDIGKFLLLTLIATGAVVAVATLPGLGHFFRLYQKRQFEKYKNHRINQSLKRLQTQKMIIIKESSDGTVAIELTEKGEKRAYSYKIEEMKLKKDSWDHLWRIVIFDIPENKKIAREFLRNKMKELGFYILQKSVLVTPWPCQEEINFIKYFYGVENNVNLITAESFDGEDKMKKYFNL